MSIGYACIALGVKDADFKSCILKNADESRLRDLIKTNLLALDRVIEYNIENRIHLYRISSDIVPFASHIVNRISWWDEYGESLKLIGKRIKDGNVRVSMHPGQYSVLNSSDSKVVQNTIEDLKYHNRFLDSLNVDLTSKIILHIGGVYGNKKDAIKRFKEHYSYLDEGVKKRLVIENDERCFAIDDVLDIGLQMKIPVVFDNLHHKVNAPKEKLDYTNWVRECRKTWEFYDGKQKIHYSQQSIPGRLGAHSNTISIKEFLEFYSYIDDMKIDIMLETKDKNISALKCIYCTEENVPKRYLEKEWGRYKYLVMSRSGALYKKIGSLFKENNKDTLSLARSFYSLVEKTIIQPQFKGAEENAALHVWGYFKEFASEKEKGEFYKGLASFQEDITEIRLLKRYLKRLAFKYKMEYLIDSYYFVQ